MAKITLMKPYRQAETLRVYELADLVDVIRNGEYRSAVEECRRLYPTFNLRREADGMIVGAPYITGKLPRICFASEMENRNHQRMRLSYTGFILLEVNNLTGYDEADAVRKGAGEVPQTMVAFVGASGHSVKIVCRGELFPSERRNDELLPVDEQQIIDFQENLYERARLAYNAQLGVTIEKLEPRTDRTCYVSYDQDAVYNPMAIPFYARPEKPTQTL